MGNFNLNEYVTVSERIEKFYLKHPEGSIQTELIVNDNGIVIFKAYIYRNQEDKLPATGHAMEKEGSSFINKTSHVENGETSAVGRALAMLGFEIKKSIASREEMENALNNQRNYNNQKNQRNYNNQKNQRNYNNQKTNTEKIITGEQRKKLFAEAESEEVLREAMKEFNYTTTKKIKSSDMDKILKKIKEIKN